MHYFKKNIGDYHKKAGRLSMMEHGAYTLLVDACYDRERFPTLDDAIDWCWARTDDEINAVKFVLSRLFTEGECGIFIEPDIQKDIESFKINGLVNQLVALAREAKRKNKIEFAQACDSLREEIKHAPCKKTHAAWSSVVEKLVSVHEASPNQEPINQEPINQEPINQEPNNIPPTPLGGHDDEKPKSKKSKPEKSQAWKEFFDAYPENKKGGTDQSAWKAAQREGLTDEDFTAMRADVLARARASPNWYSTYALGITRYISERFWKTPITPDGGAAHETHQRPTSPGKKCFADEQRDQAKQFFEQHGISQNSEFG